MTPEKKEYALSCGTEVRLDYRVVLKLLVTGSSYCSELEIGKEKIKLHKGNNGYLTVADIPQNGEIPIWLHSENRSYQDRFVLKQDLSCGTAVRQQFGKLLKEKNFLQSEEFQMSVHFRKISSDGNLIYWVKAQTSVGSYWQIATQPRNCEMVSIRLLKSSF